jgi:hypothetical protein
MVNCVSPFAQTGGKYLAYVTYGVEIALLIVCLARLQPQKRIGLYRGWRRALSLIEYFTPRNLQDSEAGVSSC